MPSVSEDRLNNLGYVLRDSKSWQKRSNIETQREFYRSLECLRQPW